MEDTPTEAGTASLSDAALAKRARAGDSEAFATLWTRHSAAALRAAQQFSSIADSDDLVAEAYTRIFSAIRAGKGPSGAFRPYLFVTIRNLASRIAQSSREETVADLESLSMAMAELEEDPAVAALDRTLTVRAFRSLPERWQTVLWYTAVEGLSPLEASSLLGLSANGTAALAHRAREGLRQAWLQAHVNDKSAPPECKWMLAHMAKFAKNELSKRNRARALQHLAECAGCSIVYEEIDEVNSHLALIMIPLMLGGAAGAGYLASQPGAALAAGPIDALGPSTGASHPATPAHSIRTTLAKSTTAQLVGVGVVLVVAAGSWAAIAAIQQQQPHQDQSSLLSADQTPAPARSTPRPSNSVPLPPTPPATTPPSDGPHGSVSPRGPLSPPLTAAPGGPPADTTALPPTITGFPDQSSVTAPSLSGSAEPGATVTVKDGAGTTISTVTAGADGRWTTGAMTTLDPRTTSLSAVQTDQAGNTSAATLVGPLAFTPVLLSPSGAAQTQAGVPFTFELGGWAGAQLSIALDGQDYSGSWTFDANGRQTRSVTLYASGSHTVSIRYLGASSTISLDITVLP